jgi:hypothetical protein
MTIEYLVTGLLVLSLLNFIGLTAALMRLYSVDTDVQAMKKSTHKIQWMPMDPNWAESEAKVDQAFEDPNEFEGI